MVVQFARQIARKHGERARIAHHDGWAKARKPLSLLFEWCTDGELMDFPFGAANPGAIERSHRVLPFALPGGVSNHASVENSGMPAHTKPRSSTALPAAAMIALIRNASGLPVEPKVCPLTTAPQSGGRVSA